MKAITIRPPYALAIAAGVKTIDNRGRPTSHRGPTAIHAAATWHKDGAADIRVRQWWLGREIAARRSHLDAADFAGTFRRILAVADLVDCHQANQHRIPADATCCSPWGDRLYRGRPAWHLVLNNIRLLEPVGPVVGQVFVPWELPAVVTADVERQLADVCELCHDGQGVSAWKGIRVCASCAECGAYHDSLSLEEHRAEHESVARYVDEAAASR